MGTFKANERPAALTTYRYTNPLILHIISIHFNTNKSISCHHQSPNNHSINVRYTKSQYS